MHLLRLLQIFDPQETLGKVKPTNEASTDEETTWTLDGKDTFAVEVLKFLRALSDSSLPFEIYCLRFKVITLVYLGYFHLELLLALEKTLETASRIVSTTKILKLTSPFDVDWLSNDVL